MSMDTTVNNPMRCNAGGAPVAVWRQTLTLDSFMMTMAGPLLGYPLDWVNTQRG